MAAHGSRDGGDQILHGLLLTLIGTNAGCDLVDSPLCGRLETSGGLESRGEQSVGENAADRRLRLCGGHRTGAGNERPPDPIGLQRMTLEDEGEDVSQEGGRWFERHLGRGLGGRLGRDLTTARGRSLLRGRHRGLRIPCSCRRCGRRSDHYDRRPCISPARRPPRIPGRTCRRLSSRPDSAKRCESRVRRCEDSWREEDAASFSGRRLPRDCLIGATARSWASTVEWAGSASLHMAPGRALLS